MPVRSSSRLLAVSAVLALVSAGVVGCSGVDEGALGQTLSTVSSVPGKRDSNTTGSTTADSEADSSTITTTQAEPDEASDAKALITPTGVVVPVLASGPDGYTVTAPCGDEALVSGGTPLYGADVVLDAGHGGEVETGAVGVNGLIEKEINLRIARRTALELNHRGHSVVLTRTGDYRVPLQVRAAIANQLDASVFVSIHHNAPTPQASDRPGTEVYTQSGSDESRRLGGLIWQETVEALAEFPGIAWAAAEDAGVLRVVNGEGEDTYGMVRRPLMPAALVELGYLSNPTEAELFASREYVEAASVALADAIERWLETDDIGGGLQPLARSFTPAGSTGHSRGCVDPILE